MLPQLLKAVLTVPDAHRLTFWPEWGCSLAEDDLHYIKGSRYGEYVKHQDDLELVAAKFPDIFT